jgi:HD superfamily phosphohydrolase
MEPFLLSSTKKSIEQSLNDELNGFRKLLKVKEIGVFEKTIKQEVLAVLQTEPLKVLDGRYQLGLLYEVSNNENWRNAIHSRLEHTIGVVAKCIVACDVINKNTKLNEGRKNAELTLKDVRELAAAAALHDCGHLPISHATERGLQTVKDLKTGISHEDRIIPLLITRNAYFEDIRTAILGWDEFDSDSLLRIASIISPKTGEKFVKEIEGFKLPKRAIQQILVSEIDMDRLDYIIRDSEKLNYSPVTLIKERIAQYIHGLTLEESKFIGEGRPKENLELCLNDNYTESVFSLLVSRVLLYKNVYFSEKVRSFEAVLTYLIGTFIAEEVSIEPLKLIGMTDDYFINTYLHELAEHVDDKETIKYVEVLKDDKVDKFKFVTSIEDKEIVNARLREEFKNNLEHRHYIDNLRSHLEMLAPKKLKFKRSDILLDVFHLKTGGGDLLIEHVDKKTGRITYKTLNDYMNGSNIHSLCSEKRLDIYMKSDLGEQREEFIKEAIDIFFKNKQHGI